MVKILDSEQATLALGQALAKVIEGGSVIFLYGVLGAGKTTFTRGFLQGLGYQDKVKSPTYTLVEPYEVAGHPVFHFDFYRVDDPEVLDLLGLDEYFDAASISLIEWPEHAGSCLPQPDLAFYFSFSKENRTVQIKAYGAKGERMLRNLKYD